MCRKFGVYNVYNDRRKKKGYLRKNDFNANSVYIVIRDRAKKR